MVKNFVLSLLITSVLFASGLFSSLWAQTPTQTPEEIIASVQDLITQVEDYQNQLNDIAIAAANELDNQTLNIIQTLINILNSLLNDIRLQLYNIYQQLSLYCGITPSSSGSASQPSASPSPQNQEGWFQFVPDE